MSSGVSCLDTLTGSSGGNDFKDEDYPRDFTLPASVPGSSGSSGSTPQVVNKSKLSGGGPNCGPIFPRIPIRDALPVIKRGNRGYGFHMKAIKVYSMQSEDFTIQHLVTVRHRLSIKWQQFFQVLSGYKDVLVVFFILMRWL